MLVAIYKNVLVRKNILISLDSRQHRWVQQDHGVLEGLEVPEVHKMLTV